MREKTFTIEGGWKGWRQDKIVAGIKEMGDFQKLNLKKKYVFWHRLEEASDSRNTSGSE